MSEVDLQGRLAFMSFDPGQAAALRTLQPVIEAGMETMLEAFYHQVRATPEVHKLFRDEGQISSAKRRQGEHWHRLFAAQFDGDYARAVRTIGQTHARIGLEPRWYVGGYALIAEKLIHQVMVGRRTSLLQRLQADPAVMAGSLGAMIKAIMLDMELAISIYIDALDEQRRHAEDERARDAAQQSHALSALAEGLRQMAEGNLTARFDADLAPQFDSMKQDFNSAMEAMQGALKAVSESADRIASGNAEISRAADELATRTERQAAGLEQTTAAVGHLTGRVRQTSDSVGHMRTIVVKATSEVEAAATTLDGMKASMTEIEVSTTQIGSITDAMDEIAFQTNLLALNAGVEAARAGDAGRGFAVVAQEVRQLAQRAAESAKTIKRLIDAATEKVSEGVGFVTRTDATVRGFIGQIREINAVIGDIAEAAQEQSQGLAEVNVAISEMDLDTQRNAAMVEETTAATHSVAQDARVLTDSLGFFHLEQAPRAHVPPQGRAQAKPAARAMSQPASPVRQVRQTQQRKPAAQVEGWSEF